MSKSDYNRFIDYCKNGDLDMAIWILSIAAHIDISAKNEEAFRSSCENGRLGVAKWLLSLKPDINISAKDEDAFKSSCSYGHLELAKWLLLIKPNINIFAQYEYAFRSSCFNGNLEVAKWLLQETLKRGDIVFKTNIPDKLNIHTEYVCIKNYPERCLECTSKYYDMSLEIIGIPELAREITKYIIY